MKANGFALLLWCFGVSTASAADTHAATVDRVIDGDTIVVTEEAKQIHVRLAIIDAPEIRQPYGVLARQHLAELVDGKEVELRIKGKDKWGRTIAAVTVNGVDVQKRAVRDGWAWCYPKPSPDLVCEDDQDVARQLRRGLWKDDSPVPPWQWRRQNH